MAVVLAKAMEMLRVIPGVQVMLRVTIKVLAVAGAQVKVMPMVKLILRLPLKEKAKQIWILQAT